MAKKLYHSTNQKRRALIVTADDFGLAVPVNEAVEIAHRQGILTSASLMVTAPAVEDAVRRVKEMPELGIGLHLTLMDGLPALPASQIPDLVGNDGRFLIKPVQTGIRLFFEKRVKQQVEAEMRAQIERFLETGLTLTHLDGHHHFHQHPTIIGLLVSMASEYGIRTVRFPQEPWWPSWRAQREKPLQRFLAWLLSVPRFTRMRHRLGKAGIQCNDFMFGLHESGRMNLDRVQRFIQHLPPGLTELYCHPGTKQWQGDDALPEDYLCVEEFLAISDPELKELIEQLGIDLTSF